MNHARPLPFVLAATDQGAMIVSRFDGHITSENCGYGVGFQLLNTGTCDFEEHNQLIDVLRRRREQFGDGVVAVDCGANIGVATITWARAMGPWGSVLSIEAQPRLFYALCGNIALGNWFNVTPILGAVSEKSGTMAITEPDYLMPGSLGSLELRSRESGERGDVGQRIDYAQPTTHIPTIAIDDLGLTRCDFIKMDVEGMEAEALRGARETLRKFRPIVFVERGKCSDSAILTELRQVGYVFGDFAMGWLCQHAMEGPVTLRVAA